MEEFGLSTNLDSPCAKTVLQTLGLRRRHKCEIQPKVVSAILRNCTHPHVTIPQEELCPVGDVVRPRKSDKSLAMPYALGSSGDRLSFDFAGSVISFFRNVGSLKAVCGATEIAMPCWQKYGGKTVTKAQTSCSASNGCVLQGLFRRDGHKRKVWQDRALCRVVIPHEDFKLSAWDRGGEVMWRPCGRPPHSQHAKQWPKLKQQMLVPSTDVLCSTSILNWNARTNP